MKIFRRTRRNTNNVRHRNGHISKNNKQFKNKNKKEKIQDEEDVKKALREEMQKILDITDN